MPLLQRQRVKALPLVTPEVTRKANTLFLYLSRENTLQTLALFFPVSTPCTANSSCTMFGNTQANNCYHYGIHQKWFVETLNQFSRLLKNILLLMGSACFFFFLISPSRENSKCYTFIMLFPSVCWRLITVTLKAPFHSLLSALWVIYYIGLRGLSQPVSIGITA